MVRHNYPAMKTLALFVALTLLSPAASAFQKFDLTGEWVIEVQTEAGSGSPTFVFKQDGEKLTGKYKGLFGEADVTGVVKGKAVTFSLAGDAQGTAITVSYEGEIESDSAIRGKVDLGGLGSGTFNGKRVK